MVQGYEVNCPACGFISTVNHPCTLQLTLASSHNSPKTGRPCSYLCKLHNKADLCQLLPQRGFAKCISHHDMTEQAHGCSGGQDTPTASALPPDPQAARLLAIILAHVAIHIIAATAGNSKRGAHKGQAGADAQGLLPWRPLAVRLLTEVRRVCPGNVSQLQKWLHITKVASYHGC